MSGYEIALNGLKTQSRAIDGFAQNILRGTTVSATETSSELPVDLVTLDGATSSVEDNLIGLTTAKFAYSANAKLFGIQRDMDQELLNILS